MVPPPPPPSQFEPHRPRVRIRADCSRLHHGTRRVEEGGGGYFGQDKFVCGLHLMSRQLIRALSRMPHGYDFSTTFRPQGQ